MVAPVAGLHHGRRDVRLSARLIAGGGIAEIEKRKQAGQVGSPQRKIHDWEEFFRVLKDMNYDGYLGLDLGMRRSLVKGYAQSVQRIQAIARKLKISVEV